jgi:hypothetical protein
VNSAAALLIAAEAAEKAEHQLKNHHVEKEHGWENNAPVATILPDFAGMIDAANGWHDPEEVKAAAERAKRDVEYHERAIDLFAVWFSDSMDAQTIGAKCLALLWCIRPDCFGLDSLGKLAKRYRAGSKQCLSKYVRAVIEMSRGQFQPRFAGRANPTLAKSIKNFHRAAGHHERKPISKLNQSVANLLPDGHPSKSFTPRKVIIRTRAPRVRRGNHS